MISQRECFVMVFATLLKKDIHIWKEIILSYCSNEQILDILQNLVIDVGEFKNLGHCTICGDTTYSYVIKI